MKRYNAIYFLLFLLLVMGAFASMAQNNYGLKLMGWVAFLFGGIFLVEFIQALARPGRKDGVALAELAAMIVFAGVFGCRIFSIYFPFIEWVFGAAGVFLLFFYTHKLFIRYRRLEERNRQLAVLGLLFHLSIILFLASMVLTPFIGQPAQWVAFAGFIVLLLFITGSLLKRHYLLEGNKVTALQMITGYRDHSVVLALLFLLFSLFAGLNRTGILPGIYSDEYPRAYYDMVNNESAAKEKTADGKRKHELFMEQYQLMLKHMKAGNK